MLLLRVFFLYSHLQMVLPTPLLQVCFWKTPNFSVLVVQIVVQTLFKKKKCGWGDVLWSLELTGSVDLPVAEQNTIIGTLPQLRTLMSLPVFSPAVLLLLPLQFLQHCSL